MGAYFVWNMMVGYTYKLTDSNEISVQLNLHNLLNSEYVRTGSTSTVIPGAPFGGVLTMRLTF